MAVTRRAVLEALARRSDADRQETTSIEALAAALDTDEPAIARRIDELVACELAHADAEGGVRITVTGEELLELDAAGETVVLAPFTSDYDA